jgi:ABC-type multidrug transport system fused ATPase/permease subunit
MAQQDEDHEAIESTSSQHDGHESQASHGSSPEVTSAQSKRHGMVFDYISPEDRAELYRIASNFPRQRATDTGISGMTSVERKDTLEDVQLGDPVLDPTSDQFDHYKWARMMLKLMDKEGVPVRKSTGVVWENLNISGSGAALQYQNNVGSIPLAPFRPQEYLFCGRRAPQKKILRNFDGVLESGELLIVLGRPGSGCSTFLKALSGELHGLKLDKESDIQYNGIPMDKMHKEFKGEVLYNQEVDKHFPHLTVGQTLEFAAAARTPEHRLNGISRTRYAKHITQVAMAVLGLSHTYNTKGKLRF